MRTTLTLDSDVAHQAKQLVAKLGKPFKQVVNEALRLGLGQLQKPPKRKKYVTKPRNLGLRPGLNLDNIAELIAQVDGDDYK
jgi:hypothetical protein